MSPKNIKILILIIGIICVSLCLVISPLLLIHYLFFMSSNQESTNLNFHKYQSLEFNPSRNIASYGMTTIMDDLGPEEFLYYKTSENHVLISHFGSEEYVCTGLCLCENPMQRRFVGGLVQQSLIYFVAALSSVGAYEYAKKYFEEQCVEEMKDSCVSNSIVAEVDECLVVHTKRIGKDKSSKKRYDYKPAEEEAQRIKEEKEEKIKEKESTKFEEFGPENTLTYYCDGYCVPANGVITYLHHLDLEDYNKRVILLGKEKASEPGTYEAANENLKDLWERTNQCMHHELKGIEMTVTVPTTQYAHITYYYVKEKFENEHLKFFCYRNSLMSQEDIDMIGADYTSFFSSTDVDQLEVGKHGWCASTAQQSDQMNIQCRQKGAPEEDWVERLKKKIENNDPSVQINKG